MRLAAPGMSERERATPNEPLRLLSRTKLYWGLAIICLIGALASPHTSSGRNIFLSVRQSDRRSAPGVDHRPRRDRHDDRHPARRHRFVGRLGDGLLDDRLRDVADQARMDRRPLSWACQRRRSPPGSAIGFLARFVFNGLARGRDVDAGRRREIVLDPWRGYRIPALLGLAVARRRRGRRTASQVSTKIRRPGGAARDAVRRHCCSDRSTARSSSRDACSPSSQRSR